MLDIKRIRENFEEVAEGVRRRGADGIAFESIVASGPNGALPHARPSGRRIDDGELVVVEGKEFIGSGDAISVSR